MPNKKNKKISIKELEADLKAFCGEDFVQHDEWIEEGKRYSAWQFKHLSSDKENGGRNINIRTGDGGAYMIWEAINDRIKNFLNEK